MRRTSQIIALTGVMAALASAANACFQPDLLSGPGGAGGGNASSAMSGNGDSGNGVVCGNGKIDPGESCDDGNANPDDGCGVNCQQEACWECPSPGSACTKTNAGCLGDTCAQITDCVSGICVDGVCCESASCGLCESCNTPGPFAGQCTPAPIGLQTDNCSGANACHYPACEALTPDKHVLGAKCSVDIDCAGDQAAGNKCVSSTCRLKEGALCSDDVQCATNRCDLATHLCTQCVNNSDCRSQECVPGSGLCKAATGEPCSDSMSCAGTALCFSDTSPGICLLKAGGNCKDDFQCASRLCVNSQCASCNENSCSPGPCDVTSGNCTTIGGLKTGAYCRAPSDCASAKCVGFPLRCQ
jgi:large repetitive protein